MAIVIQAPAKVNLFLEVEGKRPDGYHSLTTLFCKLRFFDTLEFERIKTGIELECDHPTLATDRSNLIVRAATALQQETATAYGARIRLKKRIPMGAGLGGGSSDAAATLLALQELWKLKLAPEKLQHIAAGLGADVPFFCVPQTAAIGTERGDCIAPVPWGRNYWFVLVIPEVAVSTKSVYEAVPACLTKKRNNVKLLIQALETADMEVIGQTVYNRLETITFNKYKQLQSIKKALSALGVGAVLMSGSGSVIFGLLKTREEAERVKRKLQNVYNVIVVRSL